MLRFDILLFWQYIVTVNICDSNMLCGHKAIKALDKYITKLDKRKIGDLTEKQRKVPIKATQVLHTPVVQSNDHYATLSSASKFKVNENERTDEL